MTSPLDLRHLQGLIDRATEGPWYWGGYTDRNDVRLMSMASMRPYVLGQMTTLPCLVESDSYGMVATLDACDDCKKMIDRWDADIKGDEPDMWEGYQCPRTDLPGLSFRDPADHVMRPAATYAVKEVEYRNDVVALDHPDASLIAASRNALPALVEEVADLRKQVEAWERRATYVHQHWCGPDTSWTGVDQTPMGDPAKVWRCDNCGHTETHPSPPDEPQEQNDGE